MSDTKQSIKCLTCKNIVTFTPKLFDSEYILLSLSYPKSIPITFSKDSTYCKTCDKLICIYCGSRLLHSSAKCSCKK